MQGIKIREKVFMRDATLFIDTGAVVSLVNENMVPDIEILNIKPNYKHIVSATGQPLNITGIIELLNQTSKPVIKLFKDTNIGTFEEIDEFSDEEPLPEDPYTTYSTILHSDVSDNEILIDEEEHLVNLDKTFYHISNDFQLVEDNANKSEDKEDNTGDDIISIADTLTFGDMNSSSHVIIEETIITIIID
ncbi:unnamed protein product [Mytilus coruscus]|uniref:Uncharacterized protein n=1 Tax=Mytilus coruscus TaxID=42192 RepID=A0A6J8BW74_MYTCO|nr:unnamed protein product [Mytilus coruscus]